MADNKRTFTVDEKEPEKHAVVRPSAKQTEDATMEYNRVFSRCLQNGALLRERLDQFMRQQNLWDDEREERYAELLTQINNREKKLKKGGIKLSDARQQALEMKGLRTALQSLIAQRNSLDVNTAQGQAENARFNYLLVSCLVYNDSGEAVYEDVEDYSKKQSDGDAVGVQGAEVFANMYFGLEKDYEKKLPENEFLKEYKFVNDDLQLIDTDGERIDITGRKVNDNGRYVDDKGNLIDFDGNPMTEEGEYAFEAQPFLNDEGEPVDSEGKILKSENKTSEEKSSEDTEETPKKKRGRPAKKKVEEDKKEEPVEETEVSETA